MHALQSMLPRGVGAPMDSSLLQSAFASPASNSNSPIWCHAGASGSREPPLKAENLIPEYRSAIQPRVVQGLVIIGGKSMGGRVASMIADEFHDSDKIAGLLYRGHPFHPPGEPKSLEQSTTIKTSTLICQSTKEEFGNHAEVSDFALSDRIEIVLLDDNDHDLKPRQTVAGFTAPDHLTSMPSEV